MIIPGGAIKGNMYFRKDADAPKTEAVDQAQETEDEEAATEFSKLTKQTDRYYIDSNPTVKCFRC